MMKYFKRLTPVTQSQGSLSDQVTVSQRTRELEQVQSLCLDLAKLARHQHSK